MTWAPPLAIRPYAELDFTRFALDSRITFTRASQKSYFGADGLMHFAANNECPLEYDPATGLVRGRSFWEQRTNLLLRSQEFDNASWFKSPGIVITPNAALAPDGTLTADLVTVGSLGQITQTITATATAATFSLFIKAGNAAAGTFQFILRNTTTATNLIAAGFNWATMSFTSGGSAVSSTSIGGGWYRITLSATTGITVGNTLACYAGSISFTGLTYYVWGGQFDPAAIASPYIATTSATVTRAVDNATLADLALLRFNPAGFSVFIDAYTSASAAPAGLEAYLSLNDNTSNNRVMIRREANAAILLRVDAGGVNQVGLTVAGPGANTRVKIAARVAPNDFAMSVNGSAVGTDNSGSIPIVNRGDIGHHLLGTLCNSTLRRIRVSPLLPSNSELQAMAA